MFGNDNNADVKQKSIFDHGEALVKQQKFVIDFHDRKTQIIAGVIAVLVVIFGVWLHARLTAPMVEKAVSPSQYASVRTEKQDSRHSNKGTIAKQASGHHIPDGFHQ